MGYRKGCVFFNYLAVSCMWQSSPFYVHILPFSEGSAVMHSKKKKIELRKDENDYYCNTEPFQMADM
jgi:hypothetical protein